jgi:hypothetical protein
MQIFLKHLRYLVMKNGHTGIVAEIGPAPEGEKTWQDHIITIG